MIDRIGGRRTMIGSLALFTVAATAAGAAPTFASLTRSIPAAAPTPCHTSTRGRAVSDSTCTSNAKFWLLTGGFFVCGFHVAFVGGHLPAYISDKGIGLSLFGIKLTPAELGGWAIGMVGLFNIVGAVLWSSMGAKYQRKNLLSLLYLLRSLVFLGFVVSPLSAASVLIFAGALGFLWLGTVPLTTALVGYIFGPVHLTMLNGIVFFSHQTGSFFGGWGGGRVFDLQGNYDLMWWISIALGLASAALHWPIVEKPVARPALAAA